MNPPRRIVLPEASYAEPLFRAASLLGGRGSIIPIILGRREDFLTAAHALKIPLKGVQTIYPVDDPGLEAIVRWFSVLTCTSADAARAQLLADGAFYAAGLVALGRAEGLAGRQEIALRLQILGIGLLNPIIQAEWHADQIAHAVELSGAVE